jgi:hypothetical protein
VLAGAHRVLARASRPVADLTERPSGLAHRPVQGEGCRPAVLVVADPSFWREIGPDATGNKSRHVRRPQSRDRVSR